MRKTYAYGKVDLFRRLVPVLNASSIVENHQSVVLTSFAPLKNKNVREDLSLVGCATPQTVLRIEGSSPSIREQFVAYGVVFSIRQVFREPLEVYPDLAD